MDTLWGEANSSDAIDCESPLYRFQKRHIGLEGKEWVAARCPIADDRSDPEIIRTKGYGFIWVSGAENAMKFNEKMQET